MLNVVHAVFQAREHTHTQTDTHKQTNKQTLQQLQQKTTTTTIMKHAEVLNGDYDK